ncbi:glycerol ether metabolic process [Coemansia sp. RSA 1365]|nr:glycerol ether metabolic process [Coemansia sp. RSA 1365]
MSKPETPAKPTNFIELESKEQFKEILENHKFIAIDFTASWCGPCKHIGPEFEKLSESHPSVFFVKIDVDTYSEIAQDCKVRAMPTFVFLEVDKMPKAKSEVDNVSEAESEAESVAKKIPEAKPEVLVGASKVNLKTAVTKLSKKAEKAKEAEDAANKAKAKAAASAEKAAAPADEPAAAGEEKPAPTV